MSDRIMGLTRKGKQLQILEKRVQLLTYPTYP